MRSSNELSSSPDDPPNKNPPPFLTLSGFVRLGIFVGASDGVRCTLDLYEEEAWLGEKPRTTLWQARISALVSEATDGPTLRSLSYTLGGAVEVDELDDRCETVLKGGGADCGVISDVDDDGEEEGMVAGTASVIEDERGSISCFSWMELTIFSKLKIGSVLDRWEIDDTDALMGDSGSGRLGNCCFDRGATVCADCGTAEDLSLFEFEIRLSGDIGLIVANCNVGDSAQSVWRLSNLQLMFSNRAPSSKEREHLEKTRRTSVSHV